MKRGHLPENVLHRYTIDQVNLFLQAAHVNMRQEMVDLAIAVRYAMGADQAAWREFVNQGKPPKIMTKEEAKELRRLMNG